MAAEDTATRVAGIIAEHLCMPDRPAPTDSLVDDLGADSLDGVEVTMAIEEAFKISVTDAEAEACSLVQDWTKLVDEKVAAKA